MGSSVSVTRLFQPDAKADIKECVKGLHMMIATYDNMVAENEQLERQTKLEIAKNVRLKNMDEAHSLCNRVAMLRETRKKLSSSSNHLRGMIVTIQTSVQNHAQLEVTRKLAMSLGRLAGEFDAMDIRDIRNLYEKAVAQFSQSADQINGAVQKSAEVTPSQVDDILQEAQHLDAVANSNSSAYHFAPLPASLPPAPLPDFEFEELQKTLRAIRAMQ